MSLENLTLEELQQEILRRKASEVDSVRKQLDEARKAVRELEAKLADYEGTSIVRKESAPKSRISAGERAERVLTALDGKDFLASGDIAALVGFEGASLRETLTALSQEGKLSREGKARGTKYKLA